MRYFLIILIFLTSCKTSKKVSELEQFKSDIVLKLDSLFIKFSEIRETKEFDVKADTTNTDFTIAFAPEESGKIDLVTPQGNFSATKLGNGSVTIKGQSKSLKADKKETSKIQTFEKISQKTQKTKKQETKRQSQTKTKEVTGSWFARLWWVWVVIGVGVMLYLRSIIP